MSNHHSLIQRKESIQTLSASDCSRNKIPKLSAHYIRVKPDCIRLVGWGEVWGSSHARSTIHLCQCLGPGQAVGRQGHDHCPPSLSDHGTCAAHVVAPDTPLQLSLAIQQSHSYIGDLLYLYCELWCSDDLLKMLWSTFCAQNNYHYSDLQPTTPAQTYYPSSDNSILVTIYEPKNKHLFLSWYWMKIDISFFAWLW